MRPSRREFLQSLGAGAFVAGVPQWAYARTFDPAREQAPAVRDPKYREWSAAALAEAKRLGCSYADIRFTRNRAQSIAVRNGVILRGGGGFGGSQATEPHGLRRRAGHRRGRETGRPPGGRPGLTQRVAGVGPEGARGRAPPGKNQAPPAP